MKAFSCKQIKTRINAAERSVINHMIKKEITWRFYYARYINWELPDKRSDWS